MQRTERDVLSREVKLVLAAHAAGGPNREFEPSQIQRVLFLVQKSPQIRFPGGFPFRFLAGDHGPYCRKIRETQSTLDRWGWLTGIFRERTVTRNHILGYQAYRDGSRELLDLPEKIGDALRGTCEWFLPLGFVEGGFRIRARFPEMFREDESYVPNPKPDDLAAPAYQVKIHPETLKSTGCCGR